ncbi:MAG: hypothetical protein I3I94_04570 [Acidaminococcaceae bacterium]|nr:hypothetical protein [Acidaminococcaceae bacterium]
MKLRRWPALLAVLFVSAVLVGCSLLRAVQDPFAGKWIGIVKVPLMGRSVVQADIRPVEGEKGRYHVAMAAEQYVLSEADPDVYLWQRGASLRFTGSLDGDELNLDSLMKITFLAGKVTGTVRLKDGTVLRQDTGKEKEGLRQEMEEAIRKEHPGAVFRDAPPAP